MGNISQKEIKSGGFLNEFLWTFAGVNKELLRQCPSEYSKYAGMGGTILCTGIMAMISGAYAIHFVFQNELISVCFGIFWGILILNLDRFITSTMYSDGKHSVSWQEIKSAWPRILMAIFLGIVIATPLEMKLFEERIDVEIKKIETERLGNYAPPAHLVEKEKNKQNELSLINNEIARREKDLEKQRKELDEEVMGRSKSGIAGEGPSFRQKQKNKMECEKELAEYKESKAKLESEISLIETEIEELRRVYRSYVQQSGFCQRYEAFAKMYDGNVALTLVVWFIRLLFIIIEVSPTFLRMMVASGPYDELCQAQCAYVIKLAQKDRNEIESEYQTELKINTERNRARLEAESNANQELFEKIASAQSDVINLAIDKWKEKELERAKNDPASYIKMEKLD